MLLVFLTAFTMIATILYIQPPKEEKPSMKPLLEIKRISAKEIPLHELIEIDLNVTANFQNPFDPNEIEVLAVIKTKSGEEIELPAFYYQDYKRELIDGKETLTPNGEPYWKVRFTPMELGEHVVYIKLRADGEIVTSGNFTFDVCPSNELGFARISKTDGRYIEFSGNRPLFLIGHNVCWYGSRGTYDFDEWFSSMKLNGENMARIWMAPWSFGIEWKKLGYYELSEAWRLDYMLKKAEENGIYVILCLMNHGQLQSGGLTGQWSDNPYNKNNGGPLANPEDFWLDEVARDLFKRRLKYVVARWGYSTKILAWEFWNEVELTDNFNFDTVADWHKEMAEYLRKIDPYRHLLTTSSDPRFGALDAINFVTIHKYGPENFKDIAGSVSEIIKNNEERYEKPVLITEFGADWRWFGDPYFYKDKDGVEIHNGIWSSILSGSPSSALSWWWDSYIHPYDLYYHFKALSEFLKGIDPVKARFDYLKALPVLSDPRDVDDLSDLTVYPRLGWSKPEADRFEVELDGNVSNISQLCSFLHGKAHPELKNNPTLIVNFPFGGDLMVNVNSVATSGAILEIYDNGSLLKRVVLPDKDHKNEAFVNEYNFMVITSFIPGKHVIKLDNTGGDWLSIDYVKFTGAILKKAKARIMGLNNGTLAIAWIQNSDHTWWNSINDISIDEIEEATFELSGFLDGEYVIEWWDTYDGKILKNEEAVASGGKIRLNVHDLEKDIAFKAYIKH
ncbi:MAG: cellulase family glycosylhydrolase [Thermoproteota archaeon]